LVHRRVALVIHCVDVRTQLLDPVLHRRHPARRREIVSLAGEVLGSPEKAKA
jgi:hypothetical protein